MTDIRQHLAYTEEHIAELAYEESRLERKLERVRLEKDAKEHAANEIRTIIEKERIE